MENSEEENKNWEVLIRKATAAKKKSRGRPASQIKEVDQYCSWGHRPSLQANKHQQEKGYGQGPMKDLCQQELKPSSSAPQKRKKANWSERKKFWLYKKLRRCQEQKEQNNSRKNSASDSTPATGANYSDRFKKKDNSGIIYYKCNKKGHISQNCSEPRRNNTSKN